MDEEPKAFGTSETSRGDTRDWFRPRSRAGRLALKAAVVAAAALLLYVGGRLVQREYLREQARWASLLNASGQQRMRSQRIALLALQLVRPDGSSRTDSIRRELLATVERTDRTAARLLDPSSTLNPLGMPSEELERLYLGAPHHLQRRLDDYLHAARQLAEAPSDRLTMENEAFRHLVGTAPALLRDLDRAVSEYEEPSRASLRSFQDRSLAALILVVVLALSAGLFWIQPKIVALRRRADRRARELFAAAPVGLVLIDETGAVREANRRVAEMFGYPGHELVGLPLEELVPDATSERREAAFREVSGGEDAAPTPNPGTDVTGRRRDGSSFPAHCVLSSLDLEGEPCLLCGIQDLSEQRQLRSWGVDALREAEEERRRVARDLHDEMAQRFATLQVQTRAVLRTEDEDRRRELLESVNAQLGEGTDAARRIIQGLRPMELDQLGLGAAVQSHVRGILDGGADLSMRVEADEVEDRFDPDEKVACYRIVQEAIANALTHAGASRITVAIRALETGSVRIVVEDDGRGFRPEELACRDEALGILSMRERARAAGGGFELESDPGRGTRVTVELPAE